MPLHVIGERRDGPAVLFGTFRDILRKLAGQRHKPGLGAGVNHVVASGSIQIAQSFVNTIGKALLENFGDRGRGNCELLFDVGICFTVGTQQNHAGTLPQTRGCL